MAMFNRTAERRRPLTRAGYAVSLLVLLGAATALVVVVRTPANSAVHPVGPASSSTSTSTSTGVRSGAAAPDVVAATSTDPGEHRPALADVDRRTSAPDAALHRSLIWSGLTGLAISLTGLAIVGSRRRMW
ncbi:hypothetical protein O7606_18850 [Micromonospora sp. WMMD882]|uniref:hypothetical protein n=1 Tax=Micromonospora sp. WMMD882 TaxID=3015151 RepID=UPI00248BD0E7|nr:hypothetical protein [Micromonospora sp. WMMD882]WBB78280.1 hypothetical protein O7606_18850 [Micromonospora sp. WMMD882]